MYQKLTLVGNLGNSPAMRFMADGTAVTNFSVATNRRWTDRNGQSMDETTWFRVSVWGRQAESANQYLAKGSKVLVEGRLQADAATGGPRLWTRQDGTPGTTFEVRANKVCFLSSRDEMASVGENGQAGTLEEDEIPF